MQDTIDKRNFREKCARSIVKGYNVRYVTQEETEAKKALEEAQNQRQAAGVSEKEMVFEADERYASQPSSRYGTTSVNDPVTKEQIEGLTAHVFRHNYCTNLCYQIPKVSIKKIAQLMGDTEAIVLKVYNHMILEKEDAKTAVNDAVNI